VTPIVAVSDWTCLTMNRNPLIAATVATAILSFQSSIAWAESREFQRSQGAGTSGSGDDINKLMRIPDLSSTSASSPQAQPGDAPSLVTPFTTPDNRIRTAPLAWRTSAYNLATNKLSARTKWAVPITFDKTKSYLGLALAQLGFSIKSAYPQSGQFLVVPTSTEKAQQSSAQIIIVAQPTSESETALQLIVTGDSRGLDQQKVQQIPQMMLMVIQRKGLL
jgi:hypothetical protein